MFSFSPLIFSSSLLLPLSWMLFFSLVFLLFLPVFLLFFYFIWIFFFFFTRGGCKLLHSLDFLLCIFSFSFCFSFCLFRFHLPSLLLTPFFTLFICFLFFSPIFLLLFYCPYLGHFSVFFSLSVFFNHGILHSDVRLFLLYIFCFGVSSCFCFSVLPSSFLFYPHFFLSTLFPSLYLILVFSSLSFFLLRPRDVCEPSTHYLI